MVEVGWSPTSRLAREILRVDRKVRRAAHDQRWQDIANLGTLRGQLLDERYRMLRDQWRHERAQRDATVGHRSANVIVANVMLKVLT